MQEKERLFQTELVKACVPHHQAAKAARIIASEQPDEQLTEEDIQLVEQVCRQWLEQRQRWELILRTVDKTASRHQRTVEKLNASKRGGGKESWGQNFFRE